MQAAALRMTLPPNFSLVWQDRLAGSGHPGHGPTLIDTLTELRRRGFHAILSLTEDAPEPALLTEHGFATLHLPIEDFTAPTPEQVRTGVRWLNEQLEHEGRALVHCQAGYGRTGTILACFLVSRGLDPAAAIGEIRRTRPGSLEVYAQEFAVYQFARQLRQESGEEEP
ncbi:MAG: hypothetical protein BWZ08_01561 [candidate division BRC1 bacterium ADurb.BinA292]|nr:MAG: hypothetical protein BWZ08_01561 [candidate division BRC1 bacterium ADurb.BinA292]HOR28946.1 dual specificity protein phosphatase family protein [Candidatus Sumerlaeota bacterium]